MSLQHEYDFDNWLEREYPDRDDRQGKFRMSSVRDLMLAAYSEGRATSGAASGEVVACLADVKLDVIARSYDWTIDQHGEVLGLTAGDMGYEATGIKFTGDTLAIWNDGVLKIDAPAEQSAPPVPRMVKPWQERTDTRAMCLPLVAAMQEEIADLRALLATQSASTAHGCPIQTPYGPAVCFKCAEAELASTAPGQAESLTFTVEGVVMSQMEYIDHLHGKLAEAERDAARWRFWRGKAGFGMQFHDFGGEGGTGQYISFEMKTVNNSRVCHTKITKETRAVAADAATDELVDALSKEKP